MGKDQAYTIQDSLKKEGQIQFFKYMDSPLRGVLWYKHIESDIEQIHVTWQHYLLARAI